MAKPFRLLVENDDTQPNISSAIRVVDQDGVLLCNFNGPMAYQAADAFIKYYHEDGLIAHAMDRQHKF